jgi:hypothetical protein
MDDAVWTFSLPGARWILGRAYRTDALRGISLAYLSPVSASPWLLEGVDQAIHSYLEHLRCALESGGRDIGDYNLDTGEPLRPLPAPGARREPTLAGAA